MKGTTLDKNVFKRFVYIIPFAGVAIIFALTNGGSATAVPAESSINSSDSILNSADKYLHIRGFRSNINVVIHLNAQTGRIEQIDFPPNQEDQAFWNKVINAGIFNKYIGKIPDEAAKLPTQSVTGATFSSTAAEKTIHAMLNDYLHTPTSDTGNNFNMTWRNIGAAILALINIAIFLKPVPGKIRIAVLTVNVILFGFVFHGYLSLQQIGGWLKALPYLTLSIPAAIFAAVIALSVIRGGNFYCRWLCPFGCAQELTARTAAKAGIGKFQLNFKYSNIIRKCVLAAALVAIWLDIRLPIWEPFAVFSFAASITAWSIAAVFIIISAFIPRAWCRFFCGCGELLDSFSKPVIKYNSRKKTPRRQMDDKKNYD